MYYFFVCMETVLITGSSGFIGYHVAKRLLEMWKNVIGVDNENPYYSVSLKQERRKLLLWYENFVFVSWDITNFQDIKDIFQTYSPEYVCHFAAQTGVEYSLKNPQSYIDTNIQGFFNILEIIKKQPIKNFVYASSSSIYGTNKQIPYSLEQKTENPISLYAATKKSNELFAHAYSHLYNIPMTGLRFFTVYGEYSRPDMAMLKFAQKIQKWESLEVYNNGESKRDFTYIGDVVEAVLLSLFHPQPYKVYNVGNDTPISVNTMIASLETHLWKKANCIYTAKKNWDVSQTWADISEIKNDLGWEPKTSFEQGMVKFIDWFSSYYNDFKQ